MGGIKAVVSELIQRFQQFGSAIWSIIDGTASLDEGLEKAAGSFDGMAESINNAYNAGVELAKMQQDLDDANRGIALTNANAEAQIDRLILQSKNRNLTYQQQIDLLEKGKTAAEDNFKVNQDLAQKNVDILIATAQTQSKLSKEEILQLAEGTLAQEVEYEKRGGIEDELLQKIVDAQVKKVQSEGATNNLLEKLANREAAINEKLAADAQKAADKRAKDAEKLQQELQKAQEAELKSLQHVEDLKLQVMTDSREKDQAILELGLKRQIEALDQNSPYYAAELAAIQENARKQRDDINTKWDKSDMSKQIAANDLDLATQMNHLNEMHLSGQLSEQQYAQQVEDASIAHEQEKLAIIKAAFGEQSAEYQKEYASLLSLQQGAADRSVGINKQMAKDQAAALNGGLNVFSGFLGSMSSLFEQGTAEYKAFATGQAIVSTIQGSINAYTSTAEIPIVGPILAPIAAAAALAAGYANVKKIQATKVPPPRSAQG
jgi:hypothetical protein